MGRIPLIASDKMHPRRLPPLICQPALEERDPEIEEAAASLGATR
jgi:hypothetical protein